MKALGKYINSNEVHLCSPVYTFQSVEVTCICASHHVMWLTDTNILDVIML
jgi:hypothetical protein